MCERHQLRFQVNHQFLRYQDLSSLIWMIQAFNDRSSVISLSCIKNLKSTNYNTHLLTFQVGHWTLHLKFIIKKAKTRANQYQFTLTPRAFLKLQHNRTHMQHETLLQEFIQMSHQYFNIWECSPSLPSNQFYQDRLTASDNWLQSMKIKYQPHPKYLL